MSFAATLSNLDFPLNRRLAGSILGLALACHAAGAQEAAPGDTLGNPPVAKLQALDQFGTPVPEMAGLTAMPGADRDQFRLWAYEFDIDYATYRIRNPRNPPDRPYDTVRLRTYAGATVEPSEPIVAPTLKLRPGDRLRLTLDNNLPANDPKKCEDVDDPNTPHCFNSTNMHTHGFWVSPAGNSDNVLIQVKPDVEFVYEYNLPEDHPAGTFWYHPHLHGSTALQVASGMAGALIVEGDRAPTATTPGDVDILLQNAQGIRNPDQIVLLQQIPYACRDTQGQIMKDDEGVWICDPSGVDLPFDPARTGTIEDYDQFGFGVWQPSGRYVSINGQVLPLISGEADAPFYTDTVTRWRMIAAGVRESMRPTFYKARAADPEALAAQAYDAVTDEEHAAFIDATCDPGKLIPQYSMATDGLTRERLLRQDSTVLHPGYRDDLLMVFPEPGVYCIVDGELDADQTVSNDAKGTELLAYVVVRRGPTTGRDPAQVIRDSLMAGAQRALADQPQMLAEVIADLANGLSLRKFVWHKTMMQTTGLPRQTAGFSFAVGPSIGTVDDNGKVQNPKQFKAGYIDHTVELGTEGEWLLASETSGHPFHIHVNPFQVISVIDPGGVDVSDVSQMGASPYGGLKGAWKDTIFVQEGHLVTLRTRYERYIGTFVLHCHILDHEDGGMMQNVSIVLPGTKDAPPHH